MDKIEISALNKMWISFFAIGLMVFAAIIVVFARTKTTGVIRGVLIVIAFFVLMVGVLYACVAIV